MATRGQQTGHARQTREARDWDLFADWCTSMALTALPTTAEDLAAFLADFPAPLETQGRRVKAIRKKHERAGQPLVLPTPTRTSALRHGPEWASVPRALAQVPKYQHPKSFDAAIRGRRDGWLIVLVGLLGLSRNAARDLDQADVQLFPGISIKGLPIPRIDQAAECPACAVTRWLRIAGAASFGFQNEIKAAVSPDGVDADEHDCAQGLDGVWRQANTLLPWVDRHGWVSAQPMSARSVSAVLAHRQALGPVAEIHTRVIRTGGRYEHAALDDMADAFDNWDQKVTAAFLLSQLAANEGGELLDHLNEFDL